jgi:hypothetical protein
MRVVVIPVNTVDPKPAILLLPLGNTPVLEHMTKFPTSKLFASSSDDSEIIDKTVEAVPTTPIKLPSVVSPMSLVYGSL